MMVSITMRAWELTMNTYNADTYVMNSWKQRYSNDKIMPEPKDNELERHLLTEHGLGRWLNTTSKDLPHPTHQTPYDRRWDYELVNDGTYGDVDDLIKNHETLAEFDIYDQKSYHEFLHQYPVEPGWEGAGSTGAINHKHAAKKYAEFKTLPDANMENVFRHLDIDHGLDLDYLLHDFGENYFGEEHPELYVRYRHHGLKEHPKFREYVKNYHSEIYHPSMGRLDHQHLDDM